MGPAGSLADALLPSGVLVHEALEVSARVVWPPETVNGDWFDSVPLDRGRVGLMVGDVVGRGVEAGATMAHVRSALRLALSRHADPVLALQEVDRYARSLPAVRWTRASVAVVDPHHAAVSYATAGSPAPMLVRGPTRCWSLSSTGGGPIGSDASDQRTATTLPMERGDAVLLYTDGLLGGRPRDAVGRVVSALMEPAGEVGGAGSLPSITSDRLCRRALAALDGVPEDDVVVLAAQLRQVRQPSMAIELAVGVHSARAAQQELLRWTGTLGLDEVDEIALAQATGEVVANVVEHAQPAKVDTQEERTFALRATLTGTGDVQVIVADRGRWDPTQQRSAQDGDRQGGLAVAAHFVDDLVVDTSGPGTRVVLHHRVERPVSLSTARAATGGRFSATVVDDLDDLDDLASRLEDGVLQFAGALDHRRAGEIGDTVRTASIGVERLVIDLNGVSILSSAAVRAIDERRERSTGPAITLLAHPDTPAGQVLTVMGVKHTSER